MLIAGPEGLDVLAFGERTNATAPYLTRAGVLRMDAMVKVAKVATAWDLAADAGELELPQPSPRPTNTATGAEIEGGRVQAPRPARRRLGADRPQLGSRLPPGRRGAAPLPFPGRGDLRRAGRLGCPRAVADAGRLSPRPGRGEGVHQLRAGHVVSRPAATRIAHYFRAAGRDLHVPRLRHTQEQRHRYYPRSNKIDFRGVGIIARLESLDYDDGEPNEASRPRAGAARRRGHRSRAQRPPGTRARRASG